MRTPNGPNKVTSSSINQINSAGFSNKEAMKKVKSSGKTCTAKSGNSGTSKAIEEEAVLTNMHARPKT